FVPVRRNDRVSVGASRNAQSSSPQYHAAEIQIGDSEPRKFWFRSGTTDQVVMNEIFGATQYGLGRLRRAREIKSFQERQMLQTKYHLSSTRARILAPHLLIVELHDWLLTKSASSRKFLQCISQLDRDFVYIGEDVFSISNTI